MWKLDAAAAALTKDLYQWAAHSRSVENTNPSDVNLRQALPISGLRTRAA
jgi:hypothetical protein